MKFEMLLALLLLLTFPSNSRGEKYSDFQSRYRLKIDESSMRTCWVAFGQIEQVTTGTDTHGFKCTTKEQIWTANDKQAMDYCKSKFPYHILAAKSLSNGGNPETTCVFQINLKCNLNYWQIHGKCYKVIVGEYTFAESQSGCSSTGQAVDALLNPKVADFYASNFNVFLEQIIDLADAWVTVPNLKDYFTNGKGDVAVYVQTGGFMYDMKEGGLMMDSLDAKHQILCQYDAPISVAEILYLAKVYSEIYPMKFANDSIVLPTSSYMTIQQVGKEEYNTQNLIKACEGIGHIFDAFSWPTTPSAIIYNQVKDQPHTFVLTNAYKNSGCTIFGGYQLTFSDGNVWYAHVENPQTDRNKDYCETHSMVFHRTKVLATKAAMRAPLLCSLRAYDYGFGGCPPGPSWVDAVAEFDRGHTTVCHYIEKELHTYDESARMCKEGGFNAALSGFDSAGEFEAVRAHLEHRYDHYWLGGEVPCRYDCEGNRVGSWKEGVATNQAFLNDYNHWGFEWKTEGNTIIAFRSDANAFHSHNHNDPEFIHMYHICIRSASLVVKKDKPKTEDANIV